MIDVFTGRPAQDILSRVVRVRIGGTEYELPVRSIKTNREWKMNLTERTAGFLVNLAASDWGEAFEVLADQAGDLIDLLLAYDTAGVLPSKDEIEGMEPDASMDIVYAVREVWRAASPLAVSGLASIGMTEPTTSDTSTPTSSSPTPTAGRRARSKKN